MTMIELFVMTTDINGKPIPKWQERIEQMYTDYVPFGEILSLVRYLLDERAIDTILNMPDDAVIASFPGDIEQFAAEQRQKFSTLARIVRERDALQSEVKMLRTKVNP